MASMISKSTQGEVLSHSVVREDERVRNVVRGHFDFLCG